MSINNVEIIETHFIKKLKITIFGTIENITVELKGDPS